jgi:Holliday junction resolvasome RuvABC DNA-binding subunit
MAATRVRVLVELRNGDGNFLSLENTDGPFMDAKGKMDLGAYDAAYLSALQRLGVKQEKIKELVQRVNRSD